MAKGLSDHPLEPVAGHRIAKAARDGDPQLRARSPAKAHINREQRSTASGAVAPVAARGQTLVVPSFANARCFGKFHAVKRLRPTLRRLLSTFLPPLVFIRLRKPNVFLRFLLLGW